MNAGLTLLRGQLRGRPGRVVAFLAATLVATFLLTTVVTLLVAVVGSSAPDAGADSATLIRASGPDDSAPGLLSSDAVAEAVADTASPVVGYRQRSGLLLGGAEPGATVTVASADPLRVDQPAPGTAVLHDSTARAWGLVAGDAITVRVLGDDHAWTVGAVSRDVPAGATVWVPDSDVATLPGPTGLDAVATTSAASSGLISDHAGWYAQDAAESGLALGGPRTEVGPAINALSLLLAVVLTASGIVLGTTLSLWAGQRFPDLALLRALGVRRATVRRLLVVDSVVLATAAAAVGAASAQTFLGPLSRWLTGQGIVPGQPVPGALDRLVGTTSTWLGITLICALIATSCARALWRVTLSVGVRGQDLLRSRRSGVRGLLGLGLLGLAAAPLVFTASVGGAAVAAGATAAALFAAIAVTALAPWVLPVAGWPVRALVGLGGGGVGSLVSSGLRNAPARAAAIAAPVVLTVGVGASFLLGPAVLSAGTSQEVTRTVGAPSVLTGPPGSLPSTPPDGVALLPTSIVLDPEGAGYYAELGRLDGHGISDPGTAWLDLDVVAGTLDAVGDATVAVSADVASQRGWTVGETVDAVLADGSRTTVSVGALYERDLLVGSVLTGADLALVHTPDPVVDVLLTDRPASAPPPGATTSTPTEFAAATGQRDPVDDWITIAVVTVIATYAAVATATAAGLATADRSRELDLLRMTGASRLRLVAAVAAEIVATVFVGVAVGAAVVGACVGLAAVSLGVGRFGDPVLFGQAAGGGALCLAAALIAALATARPWRGVGTWNAAVRGGS